MERSSVYSPQATAPKWKSGERFIIDSDKINGR